MAEMSPHHQARFDRLQSAKAEWAAVKAARAAGQPEPDCPNLEALNARVPLVTAVGAAMEAHAEDRAAALSARAKKAWETRRRNRAAASS